LKRVLSLCAILLPLCAMAQAASDRVSAGGYYRIMARPDFQGGFGKLGFWNLTGRLLNEGPFAALELKLDLLQAPPGSSDTWASIHARLEGGSVASADPSNGSLSLFRLAQLYARAGNILLENVTWQLGTLTYFYGDLGLYDLRPATLFGETVGLSGTYHTGRFDLLLGVGDSGFAIRGINYAPIFTGGGGVRVRLIAGHLEVGGGGQVNYEPFVDGDHFSSYVTPDVTYAEFLRKEVVKDIAANNPGRDPLDFLRPNAASKPSISYLGVGYLGFGGFGPLQWDNFFISYRRRHPDNFYTETFGGKDYTIYTADLTRERYQLQLGNELQVTIWPGRLDAALGLLYGDDTNTANTLAADEDNRTYMSAVLRLQGYLTRSTHVLVEGGLGQEHSKNGNLWRDHFDSAFRVNAQGLPDSRGFQNGDSATRTTMQLKAGIVFNPTGLGIYARPSIRLLYGVQYSSAQAAFGNGFSTDLDQFNYFPGTEVHWHHVISLESEGWF
jgi:hypothetical protein